MRYFDYSRYKSLKLDTGMIKLLVSVYEAKGRQEQYLSKKPEELSRLIEISKAQSTEASNAIEGIRTTETRLKQLVLNKSTPRNRNEEEIAGYRDALNTIHENFEFIPITPNYILELHKILMSHVKEIDDGGKYKSSQNQISGTDGNGKSYLIFKPLQPFETPIAMESLCQAYNIAIEERIIDPLILIPIFIHDFLCIHPFRDGNGRMSRLLTILLLYRSGYKVGRYISLEAKIASIKDLYYDALYESQDGWHEEKDDPTPFIKYMLSIIDMAYSDLDARVSLVTKKVNANEMVELAFGKKIGMITKTDIAELCPGLSISAVEKGIAKLLAHGKIIKLGSGRSTFYLKK